MDFEYILVAVEDAVAHVRLNRPARRNAVSLGLLSELEAAFVQLPEGVKAVVLSGEGEHFSAGLDLSEHQARAPFDVYELSQHWYRTTHRIQFGTVPVVSALHGGVIGGGLEIATATHVRVADRSAFFQLPEGERGIFVGGGATVRVGKIIGSDRMTEMMLTGRIYDAEDGHRLGLAHYLVDKGQALDHAFTLARKIATNAPLSNWAATTAIAHISDMSMASGLYTESLAAAIAQSSDEANRRMQAFLNRKKA